ncbi:MAG: metallophosphoesterase [bacterium]
MVFPHGFGCRAGDGPLPGLGWEVEKAELVTISDTMAAFSWVTAEEQITAVRFGETEGVERYLESADPVTRFHYLELPGLTSGTEYHYRLSTIGAQPTAGDEHSPGRFTTLIPPPGEQLFSFATVNDVHIGCDEVGLIEGGGEAFTWPDPENPHYTFALEAAVREINGHGVDFTIVKGDLTCGYTEAEFEAARAILDGLSAPYYPMRGNHDRVGANPDDYYLRVFGDLLPGGQSHFGFEHGGTRFLCLDSSDLETGEAFLAPEQCAWLASELQQSGSQPVMIFLHHAVIGAPFALYSEDRHALEDAVAGHESLVGVFSGHSHRDCITTHAPLGPAPLVETAATLHYPSGFTRYRVHEGGYMQVAHRLHGPNCLEWNEMTRGLYAGLAEDVLWLAAAERNFVYTY